MYCNYDYLCVELTGSVPARSEIAFENGSRGLALREYMDALLLSRIPTLDTSRELQSALGSLVAAYKIQGKNRADSEAMANEDAAAVHAFVVRELGEEEVTVARKPKVTIQGVRKGVVQALRESFLEHNSEYGFSESHPRPYRSSLVTPMLLTYVPGLSAAENVAKVAQDLVGAFNGVPKISGGEIGSHEANQIVRDAMSVCDKHLQKQLGVKAR